jgi:quercetin dioxygenase-like cupin family protein
MMKRLALVALSLVCLVATFASTSPTLPQMRMTPAEVQASSFNGSQVGSSGVAGVHTRVLFGDPAKDGFYTILLFVPAHTTIQAHSHRDDRMAAVLSGAWHFGYGNRFDETSLKTLPQGSVYSEPGGVNHFARTTGTPVIVEISGYGPTNTRYFDPANDPNSPSRKESSK